MKRGSALRRMPASQPMQLVESTGGEGDICVFELHPEAAAISIEASTGRALLIAPGDRFLGTAGYRESTRWVVGDMPSGGLVPGEDYWVLADCGVVGTLLGDSPREKGHLGQVRFIGTMHDPGGARLNIRQFALRPEPTSDPGAPVFLVLGTSSEVGKTTAAIGILRAMRRAGMKRVLH
jgi:hypothetical protein